MKTQYLFVSLFFLLSACGFHLRGTQQNAKIEVAKVYVVSEGASLVTEQVKAQLRAAGSASVASVDEAKYTLTLYKEYVEQIVLSASAETGKVQEYQLILTVGMTVSAAGSEEALASEKIRLTRDYTFDDSAVLGKATEEKLLRDELAEEAAAQVLRHLSNVSNNNK